MNLTIANLIENFEEAVRSLATLKAVRVAPGLIEQKQKARDIAYQALKDGIFAIELQAFKNEP